MKTVYLLFLTSFISFSLLANNDKSEGNKTSKNTSDSEVSDSTKENLTKTKIEFTSYNSQPYTLELRDSKGDLVFSTAGLAKRGFNNIETNHKLDPDTYLVTVEFFDNSTSIKKLKIEE